MDDLISRWEAINALERKKDKNAKGDVGGFYNRIIQNDIDTLMQLPSAQPELAQDLPNACTDAISRQAAINALREEFKKSPTTAIRAMSTIKRLPFAQSKQKDCESCRYNAYEWDEEPCDSCTGVGNHWKPSAQPEIIHCRDCKWHNREINQCNAQICASMCGEDFCSYAERREE